ncbi:MAG: hypothetical protein ACKOWP_01935, partial [Microbacteriaceae bacterium]
MTRRMTLSPAGCGVLLVMFIIWSIAKTFSPDIPESAAPRTTYSASAEPSPTESETATPTPTPIPTQPPVAQPGTALAVLDTLAVKDLGPQSGYDREEKFGDSWVDVDWNGCDTRNDILRRDFEDITRQDDCLVYTGVIEDPYTGEIINFTRGRGTSNAV